MSYDDIEQRPVKRRRFLDDAHCPPPPASNDSTGIPTSNVIKRALSNSTGHGAQAGAVSSHEGFDTALFESVVGQVPEAALNALQDVAGNNTERAINMYLDGSWETAIPSRPRDSLAQANCLPMSSASGMRSPPNEIESEAASVSRSSTLALMPLQRYVGAFGVGAWATRSGVGILRHGEIVKIERTRSKRTKLGRGGKTLPLNWQRADIIVRFTNQKGDEIGRLPKETAAWVSSLIDQHVCHFQGTCVLTPERLRINDTIYLQLHCYLLREAFESGRLVKPLDNNRKTGIFEEKETAEEQDLRLRQVGLVKLFDEINLQPYSLNALAEKHTRQELLQAAEIAEQYEKNTIEKKAKIRQGSSSHPSDEEAVDEGKELEQSQLDTLYQKAQSFDLNTPTREPAGSFVMDLRNYQKQALYWMIGKEKDEKTESGEASMHPLWEEYKWPTRDVDGKALPQFDKQSSFYVNPYSGELSLNFPVQEQHCLGGIVADEMGLGKTIEMLSLMHSHRSEVALRSANATLSSVNNLTRLPKNSFTVEPAPCTTLVIAPMSLLTQWESEAAKASKPGTLKTMIYYGSEKAVNLQDLCCEANATSAPHLLITSYGVVLSEFTQLAARGGDRGSHGGLFSLVFFRIILDEAHFIKNRQSKTAKACYELSARHRWVLTGTPIVNRLEDLFSLVRFLRVEPWSNFSFWKTFITVPFESKDFIRALDVVQTVLEPLVLRRTKDMKRPDGSALVPLPPRTIEIEEIELSKSEQEVYDYIFLRAKRTFNATVEAGTLMKSYTTIFAQILRLRQSCCHPILTRNKTVSAEEEDAAIAADAANGLADDMDLQSLIDRFTSTESEQDVNRFGAHVLQQIQSEVNNECPICSEEPMNEPAVTGCWHSACKQCLLDYIEHQKDKHELPRCFNCREPINQRDVFEIVRHEDDRNENSLYNATLLDDRSNVPRVTLRRVGSEGSAKIAALVKHLKRLHREEPDTKTVVFSQFTSFLDLIGPSLSRESIPFLRFDGAMSQKARATVLSEYAKSKEGCVLLLSLRAGGVGLNLVMAKRVYMMDPWWSFAVEAQAIDRVHRMGQESEVKVVRFVVAGSIEQRMLKVQERKRFIASSLGMMNEEEKRMQRIEDIKELLS